MFHLIDHTDFDSRKNKHGFIVLERFLVNLLKSCNSLKSLYLSFVEIGNEAAVMEIPYRPEEFAILQDALSLVDQIVTQTSSGLYLEIGLPSTYYWNYQIEFNDEDEKMWRKSEHGEGGFYLSKGEDDDMN
ncbi:hypothetical protein N7478_007714 [Penicillium angulare]|uniref:uncharacterized protein n=1 Tax=Penicillium angulare TaxID=116970 RepID=UPI0025411195|nr:uncharacterized protein N7478_007714 [Penicillium angulare]KAJ5272589.1 hypothetical protein N7478_007714 [Penicillium angulare]